MNIQRKLALLTLAVCALMFALPTRAVAGEPQWIRVTSPNFVVYSDAGEKRARTISERLEGYRALLLTLFPKAIAKAQPEPLVVFAFKNDGAFKPFKPLYNGKPASLAGVFLSSSERDMVALDASAGEQTYSTVFHEYIHKIVASQGRVAPWYNEGIAEFYSTATTQGATAKIGLTIDNHVLYLRERRMLPLAQLFAVTHGSPDYNERSKQGVFYAQSWLVVHFFLTHENPDYGKFLYQVATRVAQGEPAEKAFPAVFGFELATAEKLLSNYVRGSTFARFDVPFKPTVEPSQSRIEPAPPAEVEFHLGAMMALEQRYPEAEARFHKAAELDPASSLPHEGLGFIALRNSDITKAGEAFGEAIKRDSKSFRAQYYFAVAALEGSKTMGPPPGAREALERAVSLNPAFVESYYLLAMLSSQAGQHAEAGKWAERGLKVAPDNNRIRYALANTQLAQGQYDLARANYRQVAETEDDEGLREIARRAFENVERYEAGRRLAEEPPTTEPTEAPEPEERPRLRRPDGETGVLEGVLTKIECVGSSTAVVVKVGDRVVKLSNPSADDVLYMTDGTFADDTGIECGAAISRPVKIYFDEAKNLLKRVVFLGPKK